MAFDREAYLAAKKAKKQRQKENKNKPKNLTPGSTVGSGISGSTKHLTGRGAKVRASSSKPRVGDDAASRAASRLSPEDRAALNSAQFSGSLGRPAAIPHLQTAVSTGTATPEEERSPVVETPFKPDYERKGAAEGVKPIALDPDRWEFTCPTCHEVKHESQRNTRSKLGKCIDCMPKK